MVALRTTTTFIVLKVWNNQLHQPPFCHSFPLLLDYLNFVILFLQYQ